MCSPRIIIYDFDGTLANSEQAVTAVYNDVSEKLGMGRPYTLASLRERGLMGGRGDDILLALFGQKRFFEARHYHRQADEHIALMTLYENVHTCLAALQQRDIQLAIATNQQEPSLREALKHLQLEQYFSPHRITCLHDERVNQEERVFGAFSVKSDGIGQLISGFSHGDAVYIGDAEGTLKRHAPPVFLFSGSAFLLTFLYKIIWRFLTTYIPENEKVIIPENRISLSGLYPLQSI
ncbi:MAG: HAD family hydrolase [Nanoarchaeota archaeon]